ncbi:MAG TPA: ABC transporter permease [Pseudomonas sp.]|uniref:ABC transporter permease n=1 Tax=Pseudomonas sp. TaxID=306 RepID=UPI002ED94AF0
MPLLECRSFLQRLAESVESLCSMGQRSLLALIGIMVGSASIVALLNIGRSASDDALRTFKGLGTDTLVASFPRHSTASSALPIHLDAKQLIRMIPALTHVAAVTQYSTRVSRTGLHTEATIIGTTASLRNVMGLKLASGRFLSRHDRNAAFVVVGAAIVQALQGTGPLLQVGDWLQLGSYQFQVIGLVVEQPYNPLIPVSVNDSVFIPATSMGRLTSSAQVGNVIARVVPHADLVVAALAFQSQLSNTLGGREVDVQVPQQLLDGLKRQANTFTWLLAGLGAISLIVAGVGVMNVMLMSVNERRREIGVRLALGARRRDIQQMFLLEATHLSVVGALLGALLGAAVAYFFTHACGWPLSLSLDSLLLGVGSSILIGLFFGCYPATVASRLSPVVALRDD